MADADQNQAGTVETTAETKKSPSEFTRHWLQAIELASDDEKHWRDDAKNTNERYTKTKQHSFNMLFTNTQTTVPALYNSEPVPDCRRRFGDKDEVGKTASDMLERLLTIGAELYDFDGTMKAAVKDRELSGRAVTRVRVVKGQQGSISVQCEPVQWDDYRHGPAKTRKDLPWEAFRHKMTREELVKLNPEVGPKVNLDAVVAGAESKKSDQLPDMFKRAIVWEVWDRLELQVYFFAESFKDGPLKVMEDPYKLRDFFCTPRPLYAVEKTDSLTPTCPFMIWKPLADEVDGLTARISGIVSVMKMRGLYAGQFSNLIAKLDGLSDGQLAPAEDSARAMQEGGLDKAIWMWPVDLAIQVVQGLYEAREQAKNALYEMTGVADILRGSTQASETATAQQIKAQWGSLRLQEGQRDVQRYARDLLRMIADLSCQEMEFAEMTAITGISFMPKQPQAPQMGHNGGPPMADPAQAQQAQQQQAMAQQQAQMQAQQQAEQLAQAVEKLLKGPDLQREFVIEIETDSTIRADLSRAQQNISGFITGLGEFMTGVGPAVQMGFMPPEIAVKYIGAFARNFKLGREAEALTDEWVSSLEQKAANPQPPKEDPQIEIDRQRLEAETQEKQARLQMDGQEKLAKHQLAVKAQGDDVALRQQEIGLKHQEVGLKQKAIEQDAAMQQQGFAHEAAQKGADREHGAALEDRKMQHSGGLEREKMAHEGAHKNADRDESGAIKREKERAAKLGDEGKVAAEAGLGAALEKVAASLQETAKSQAEVAKALTAEEHIERINGPDGKMIGARKRKVT